MLRLCDSVSRTPHGCLTHLVTCGYAGTLWWPVVGTVRAAGLLQRKRITIAVKSKDVLFSRSYGLINLLSSVLEAPVNSSLFSDVFYWNRAVKVSGGARNGKQGCGGSSPPPLVVMTTFRLHLHLHSMLQNGDFGNLPTFGIRALIFRHEYSPHTIAVVRVGARVWRNQTNTLLLPYHIVCLYRGGELSLVCVCFSLSWRHFVLQRLLPYCLRLHLGGEAFGRDFSFSLHDYIL